MKWFRHPLVQLAIGVVLVLAAHAALLWWLMEKTVVAVLLSAGPHSPRGTLLAAGLFLVVRMLAVLFLPATVLAHLGCWIVRKWRQHREK